VSRSLSQLDNAASLAEAFFDALSGVCLIELEAAEQVPSLPTTPDLPRGYPEASTALPRNIHGVTPNFPRGYAQPFLTGRVPVFPDVRSAWFIDHCPVLPLSFQCVNARTVVRSGKVWSLGAQNNGKTRGMLLLTQFFQNRLW